MDNDRIRREASRHLVDAALAAGATRYVQESITFIYADAGERWIDEDAPLDVPPYARSVLDAEAQAERFTARRRHRRRAAVRAVLRTRQPSHRRRRPAGPAPSGCRHFGRRDGYLSSITTDDAAAAVVAALDATAGIYNVVDDEPLTRREHFDAPAVVPWACASCASRRPVAAKVGGARPRCWPVRSGCRTSGSRRRRDGHPGTRACARAGRRSGRDARYLRCPIPEMPDT